MDYWIELNLSHCNHIKVNANPATTYFTPALYRSLIPIDQFKLREVYSSFLADLENEGFIEKFGA